MKTERVGQKVHSDIVAQIDASFRMGFRYICTLIDDFLCFTFFTFLRRRSDVKDAFKEFVIFLGSSQRTEILLIDLHSEGAVENKEFSTN